MWEESNVEARNAVYRALLPVGIMVLTLSVTAFLRVPLLPDIGRELSMTTGELGLITSLFAVGRLLADLPAGRALETQPPRRLLMLAAAAMLLGSVTLGGAIGPVTVYVAALVLGVSSAVTNATGMHAFSVAVPPRLRGRSLAFFSMALLGGQALGPLLGGVVAARSSWRVAAVIGGVMSLAVALLVLRPWARNVEGGQARATPTAGTKPATTTADDSDRAASSLRSQRSALLFVSFAMFFTLGAMPQTIIPVIGARQFGLDVGWIGLALGVGGGCRLLGGFVGGMIADRISRRAALIPGLILQAGGVALLMGDTVTWWLAGIIVLSLASWSISVGAAALADIAPTGALGPQLGGFRFVGDAGLMAGPFLAGQLFDLAGKAVAVAVVVVMLLLAASWSAVTLTGTAEGSA